MLQFPDTFIVFYINAHRRYKASCELALEQLNSFLDRQNIDRSNFAGLFQARRKRYDLWRASLLSLESPYFVSRLRRYLPESTTVVMEAVTNAIPVIHHLNLTKVCQDGIPLLRAVSDDRNSQVGF